MTPAGGPDEGADADADVLPEVTPALVLFERGDYRGAAGHLHALLAAVPPPPPPVARAAGALLTRMAPDPWALRLGIIAAALLAVLVAVYVF